MVTERGQAIQVAAARHPDLDGQIVIGYAAIMCTETDCVLADRCQRFALGDADTIADRDFEPLLTMRTNGSAVAVTCDAHRVSESADSARSDEATAESPDGAPARAETKEECVAAS